ncbi:MAG: ATP-binding protein, partial [Bdellovibrionales bacterium]|nr:ATP-binding protein [Bdellovibrionales bacterium]
MRFENLVLVERSEIESFRSVRNSIREYAAHADDSSSNRPLSIAMFGPPGTGKSFAVGQLVASVNRSLRKSDRKLELLKFNVSQFSDLNDLSLAAQYISNTNHDGRVPVAFFDEFDCERNGESLGWLRYFLTPMQDGYLRGAKAPIKLGPAVLMFAGGVFHCFDQFVPGESHTITGEFSPEQSDAVREFRQRKGPDFVSRLSSHIDILPIDRAPNEYKAIVRRSLLLRGFLQRHGYIEMRGGLGVARIDRDVLYALLTMDRYRHGIRSMETVIAMCASKSKWLDKGALPPDVQLDMHLDVREFMIRMYRGRVRHSGQYETHTFGVQGSDDQLSTHGQFGDDDPQVSPGVKARKGKRSSPEPKSGSETGKPDTPAARKKTKRKRK